MRKLSINLFAALLLTVGACVPCKHCQAQCRNGRCGSCPCGTSCACVSAPGGVGTCGSYACPANGGGKATVVVTGADNKDVTFGDFKSYSGRPRTFQTPPLDVPGYYQVTVSAYGKATTLDVSVFPGETTYLTVAPDGGMKFKVPVAYAAPSFGGCANGRCGR